VEVCALTVAAIVSTRVIREAVDISRFICSPLQGSNSALSTGESLDCAPEIENEHPDDFLLRCPINFSLSLKFQREIGVHISILNDKLEFIGHHYPVFCYHPSNAIIRY